MDLDDNLALGSSLFDIAQGIGRRVEGEGSVKHRLDDAGLDERGDFTQLRTAGSHEHEGVAHTLSAGLAAYTVAQQAHDQSQHPGKSLGLGELWGGWSRDGNELAARFEDLQRFLQFIGAQAVQHDVIVLQDAGEILLLVIDDYIRAQGFYPRSIAGAGTGRNEGTQVLGKLDGEAADAA